MKQEIEFSPIDQFCSSLTWSYSMDCLICSLAINIADRGRNIKTMTKKELASVNKLVNVALFSCIFPPFHSLFSLRDCKFNSWRPFCISFLTSSSYICLSFFVSVILCDYLFYIYLSIQINPVVEYRWMLLNYMLFLCLYP